MWIQDRASPVKPDRPASQTAAAHLVAGPSPVVGKPQRGIVKPPQGGFVVPGRPGVGHWTVSAVDAPVGRGGGSPPVAGGGAVVRGGTAADAVLCVWGRAWLGVQRDGW
jgi:hypothetical protein